MRYKTHGGVFERPKPCCAEKGILQEDDSNHVNWMWQRLVSIPLILEMENVNVPIDLLQALLEVVTRVGNHAAADAEGASDS